MRTYLEAYKINEKGIYYTTNERYNEVGIHYDVVFGQDDTNEQLKTLLRHAASVGAEERSRQIGRLLGVTK